MNDEFSLCRLNVLVTLHEETTGVLLLLLIELFPLGFENRSNQVQICDNIGFDVFGGF
jgi:hypothetical protein